MGRGLPSWFRYRTIGAVHDTMQLAELAVRLGSIVTFDRRGNVIWLESFENGLNKWTTGGSGSLRTVLPCVTYARSGGLSARITAGSTLYHHAYITKDFLFFPAVTAGFEFSWLQYDELDYLQVDIRHYTGTHVYDGGLRYDYANKRWEYGDDTTGWTPFLTGWDIGMGYDIWHTIKLALDLENAKYMRAIINKSPTDLSDVDMRSEPDTDLPELYLKIKLIGRAGNNDVGYCDDVIITQNEA